MIHAIRELGFAGGVALVPGLILDTFGSPPKGTRHPA